VLESVDAEESCGCMITLILTGSGAPIVFSSLASEAKTQGVCGALSFGLAFGFLQTFISV
jgi:hypothetical protein